MQKKIWQLLIFLFLAFLISLRFLSIKPLADFSLNSNESVSTNLYLKANNLLIDGNVLGDLIVFAKKIEINGEIRGDLIAIAEEVYINGKIEGSARLFAKNVSVSGVIARNLNLISHSVLISQKGLILGDILSLKSKSLNLSGKVNGAVYGRVRSFSLDGQIAKDLRLSAENLKSLFIENELELENELNYYPKTKLIGSTIDNKNLILIENALQKNMLRYLNKLIFIFFSIFFPLLSFLSFSKTSIRLINLRSKRYLHSLLKSISLFILSPALILILIFSGLGIFLALALSLLYLSFIIFGIFVAVLYLKKNLNFYLANKRKYLSLFITSLFVSIILILPYLFFPISILLSIFGLSILKNKYSNNKIIN